MMKIGDIVKRTENWKPMSASMSIEDHHFIEVGRLLSIQNPGNPDREMWMVQWEESGELLEHAWFLKLADE